MTIEPRIRFLPDEINPRHLEWNGLNVHSRDPFQEAARQADTLLSSNPEAILCLGPGLGYLVEELLRRTNHPILWVEENQSVRRAALHRLSPLLAHLREEAARNKGDGKESQRRWIENDNGLRLILYERTPSFRELKTDTGLFLRSIPWHSNRVTLCPSYLTLIAELEHSRFRETVNRNTLLRFDRLWVKNAYYNMARHHSYRPVDHLFKKFSGITTVIASAGPSLDNVLPQLQKYRDRFLLIAVDTALTPLRYASIDPDYVLAVDAQPTNFLHSRTYKGKADLVVDPTVSYLLPRHLSNSAYVFDNHLPLVSALLTEFFGSSPGELRSGGSVSTNALELALKMGCGPIYLCGLDLSFPGLHVHARGSALEEAVHSKTSRLSTIDKHNYGQLTAIDRRTLPGLNGFPVLTNDKLRIFYDWYVTRFRDLKPGEEVCNVYGGGAHFPEIPSIGPKDFDLKMQEGPWVMDQITELKNKIREIPAVGADRPMKTMESLHHRIAQVRQNLDGILFQLKKGNVSHPRKLENPITTSLNQALEKQSATIRLLSSGMQRDLAGLIDGTAYGQQNTIDFYENLRSACSFHIQMIETAMHACHGG